MSANVPVYKVGGPAQVPLVRILGLSGGTDPGLASQVQQNTEDIQSNKDSIDNNSQLIAQNQLDITKNTDDITQNSFLIQSNTDSIDQNSYDISQNTSQISSNTAQISQNTAQISSNVSNIALNLNHLADLDDKTDQQQEDIDILSDSLTTLNTQVQDNSARIDTLEQTNVDISDLEQRVQYLEDNVVYIQSFEAIQSFDELIEKSKNNYDAYMRKFTQTQDIFRLRSLPDDQYVSNDLQYIISDRYSPATNTAVSFGVFLGPEHIDNKVIINYKDNSDYSSRDYINADSLFIILMSLYMTKLYQTTPKHQLAQ
jgi:methyl-accepting chemotaxis protein